MKNATPTQVSTVVSFYITAVVFVIIVTIKLLIPELLSWVMVIFTPSVTLIVSILLLNYFIENFIYRKIKLIYKIIYDSKIPDEEKPSKPKLARSVIDKAETAAINWKKSKSIEFDKLKELEEFRKEFLGNVFHELKTPIFNIQGYLETLIDGGLDDDNIKYRFLKKANKNALRMAEIVDDLQMISNLEDRSFALTKEKFDITGLISDTIDSLEMRAEKKDITVEIKSGCNKPFYVVADREMIQQVVNNLITNSIKYGDKNGRTQVGIYDMNDKILVEVSDNGIGIEKQHLARIFERFYRVDKNRSRQYGGSGLGLSIVKHIIEAHKQSVNVRSTIGVGTTFGFTLKKA
jgi:two-component system phosphate regulon sensor histidine kinase PhoR